MYIYGVMVHVFKILSYCACYLIKILILYAFIFYMYVWLFCGSLYVYQLVSRLHWTCYCKSFDSCTIDLEEDASALLYMHGVLLCVNFISHTSIVLCYLIKS